MAINFPDSPSEGQTQDGFRYNSSKGVWEGVELARSVTVSDTAPSTPKNGDFWFDSTSAKLYMRYQDGSSNQWVSLSVAGPAGSDGAQGPGVTSYTNLAGFPSSGNSVGDFAFAQDTKALYHWDGTEWDRINAGGDETPRLTTTPACLLYTSPSPRDQ